MTKSPKRGRRVQRGVTIEFNGRQVRDAVIFFSNGKPYSIFETFVDNSDEDKSKVDRISVKYNHKNFRIVVFQYLKDILVRRQFISPYGYDQILIVDWDETEIIK